MSETCSPGPTKPVNINISFNISRKQVTQNINSNQCDSTISLHNRQDEETSPNLKPKNHFYRAPKTPELIYTDRNNFTKEFEFVRPTEELKRKRKVKRNSGDYTVDRVSQMQVYHNELEKSVQGHKRGYSTSFAKKQTQQTGTKKKKSTTKGSDQLYRQNRTVNLYQNQKEGNNKFSATKSLKGMISKMINSELSKRSLPLPVVGSKSKYSHSTSLTSKKLTTQKQSKKRGSKSQALSKQKPSHVEKNMLIAQDPYHEQSQRHKQLLNRSQLLQKLGNFKSVQNSMLFFEVDKLEQQEEKQACSQSKLIQMFYNRHKIEIRTDQSIECIDEIHEMEKQKFREEFFEQNSQDDYLDLTKNQQTNQLLQTYITLFKEQYNNNQTGEKYGQQSDDGQPFYQILGISATKRTKSLSDEETQRNIMQNRQDIVYDANYLNTSDLIKVDDLLMSPNNKKSMEGHQNKNVVTSTENTRIPSFMLIQQVVSHQEIEEINQLSSIKQQTQVDSGYLTREQILALRAQSNVSNQIKIQQNSSVYKQQSQQEKVRLNQFKKNEIQKWSYLLEYIKTNANNESNTQQVLQHVYSYLSKAKVDLIRQGTMGKTSGDNNNQEQHQQTWIQLPKPQQLKETHKSQEKQKNLQVEATKNYSSKNKANIDSEQSQALKEQVRSFKDQYESDNDEDIKFMNLQTIESALKNRLKILNTKKHKQLLKLQSSLQEQKISLQKYNQQRQSIQKWFKAETKQIEEVKRNIWKGYNEAKGILDKSYITAKIQHQRKNFVSSGEKHSNESKLSHLSSSKTKKPTKDTQPQSFAQKKQRKMMKCLSQSYLKKSHISYKQVVEEQERHLEEEEEEKQDEKSRALRRSKYQKDDDEDDESEGGYENGSKELKEDRLVGEEMMMDNSQNSVNEKLKIIQAKHQQESNASKSPNENQQSPQQLNLLTINQPKPLNPNDFSPTMMHYEQISKNLGEDSYSDEGSQQSFNYYASSHDSDVHPYEYEEQKSVEGKKSVNSYEKSPGSVKQQQSPKTSQHINQFNCQPSNQQHPLSLPTTKPIQNKYHSLLQSKLPHLTQDDRQDIFQFLFLDLCIELYQQPCYDDKIMDQIHRFMQKQVEMGKRKKGVKTNLNVVKDYLKRFCGYVLRTNRKVLANMNVPMGPTALEMLRYMHENDSQDILDDGDTVTLIVPIPVFDTFQRSLLPTLEFERYYDDQAKQHQRINFLKNIIHIHNKALFDALNEYLDQQRPFGIWGEPFPWKKSSSFSHQFTQTKHQQKLKKSAQKVVQACSYVCGLLVDKQQSLIGNSKVSPGYIQQIREDRISRMLANDMIQNEERWVFYDDEETEVLVEVTNSVYGKLVMELVRELRGIMEQRGEGL